MQGTYRQNTYTQDAYQPCSCGSGEKFKFCCRIKFKDSQPEEIVKQAASFPVCECKIMDNWQEHGATMLYVVRRISNSAYILGGYLVDYYCLGLKNSFWHTNISHDKVKEKWSGTGLFSYIDFAYEDARSLILGSINYADNLGLKPERGWQYSKYIVEADRPYIENFEYGYQGKPFYIQGPYDDAKVVMKTLEQKCGMAGEGYHYMVEAR